jgi:hypothetical protein
VVAQLLALAAVLVAILVPFGVEIYKGTRWKDEQNRVVSINAWAEQVTPSGTPSGYCHLKYVVSNGSGNDIMDVAVVPPGRDKLRFVHVIHAGTTEEEVDPNLRKLDPNFSDYPVELLFTDRWGLLWHQHRRLERVRAIGPNPRTIRDYEPHRNPRGMAAVWRQGLAIVAGCFVVAAVAFGIAVGVDDPGDGNSPKPGSTAPTKKAGE